MAGLAAKHLDSLPVVGNSEFLLHTNILTYIHFDEDIFAGGNCYDAGQYGVRNV